MTTSTEMRGVTGPDEPGRGYRINRKPVLIAVLAAAVAVAVAVALYFTLSGSGESGATGILHRDGYTVTQTISHDQLVQQINSSATSDESGLTGMVAGWLDSAAVGTKGDTTEAVIKLTPQGEQILGSPMVQGLMFGAAGEQGMKMHVEAGYLVITTPTSSYSGIGARPSTLPEPVTPSGVLLAGSR